MAPPAVHSPHRHHRASSTSSAHSPSPSSSGFQPLTKTQSLETATSGPGHASTHPYPGTALAASTTSSSSTPTLGAAAASSSTQSAQIAHQLLLQQRQHIIEQDRARDRSDRGRHRQHRSKSEVASSPREDEEEEEAAAAARRRRRQRQRQRQQSGSIHPSPFQPRLAVVLNVPPPWHPWLFLFRLLSILPALWWGLPSLAHLILQVLPGQHVVIVPSPGYAWTNFARGVGDAGADGGPAGEDDVLRRRYALTEAGLATTWCFASGYLSFFFTDCLMSRWLINYTPQATIVRLLAINAVNAYTTSTFLSLAGGFQDPRLLLPGWISIATTLTIAYHITHQKINIRKETSTSINVFSIASYLSMVVLLAHLLAFTPEYPTMPIVTHAQVIWERVSLYIENVQRRMERQGEM